MEEIEIYKNAKLYLKYLVVINAIFIILTILELYFSAQKSFPYFLIFYFIEALLFVMFFVPSFVIWLFKGKSIKYSLSRAMLNFGDCYQYITSW